METVFFFKLKLVSMVVLCSSSFDGINHSVTVYGRNQYKIGNLSTTLR